MRHDLDPCRPIAIVGRTPPRDIGRQRHVTVALHQQGLFSWPDWAQTLSRHIAAHPDDGRRYYDHWLAALEEMMERCQLGTREDLHRLQLSSLDLERIHHTLPLRIGEAICVKPKTCAMVCPNAG